MNRTLFYTRKILTLYGYGKAFYFFMYVQFHRKDFIRWFDFVETALPEGTSDIFKIRLAMRAAFRFVSPQFIPSARIDILINHYTTLIKCLSPAVLSGFLEEGAELQIAEMKGQSGKKYTIKATNQISKEGALKFTLMDAEAHKALAFLTGVIGLDRDRRPVFWVGMLRGPGGKLSDGKQLVVGATRDMNGLRPKHAVLHAAIAWAEWFHAGEIIAPGAENQIAIKNWFKGRKIYADYDSFWQEFTKETAPDGSYHLTLPLPRRDPADVQSKRRKDWILRYARIDAASASIKDALNALAAS